MKKQWLTGILLSGLWLNGVANAQTCSNLNMMESTPTSGFVFHPGGTATHTTTGLTWKRCVEGMTFADNDTPDDYLDDSCRASEEAMSWAWTAALQRAKNSNFAGHTDWRVPDLKELKSIVEYCRVSPAVNTVVFPDTPNSVTWSSSPMSNGSPPDAWGVSFANGDDGWTYRDGGYAVRLVRSGQ